MRRKDRKDREEGARCEVGEDDVPSKSIDESSSHPERMHAHTTHKFVFSLCILFFFINVCAVRSLRSGSGMGS